MKVPLTAPNTTVKSLPELTAAAPTRIITAIIARTPGGSTFATVSDTTDNTSAATKVTRAGMR